jgi:hypothetical protein
MSDTIEELIAADGLEELDERINYSRVAFIELAESHLVQCAVELKSGQPGKTNTTYTFSLGSDMHLYYRSEFHCGSDIREQPDIADILNAIRDDVREYQWIKKTGTELDRYAAWRKEMDSNYGAGYYNDDVASYRQIKACYEALLTLFEKDGFKQLMELEGL